MAARPQQRKEPERKWEGKRLEKGRQTRWQGLQKSKGRWARQGQTKGKVKKSEAEEDEDERGEKMSPCEEFGPSPGQGERATEGRFSKAPDLGVERLLEGEKSRKSCEYTPSGTRTGTTIFSEEEFGKLAGSKLVGIGDLLYRLMDDSFKDVMLHSKSQPSRLRNNAVFPLPLSSVVIEGSKHPAWVKATCRALNLLYGEPDGDKNRCPGAACLRALKFVVECIDDMSLWDDVFVDLSFDTFFQSKGVDYRGEEVKTAQRFSWTSLKPAMPPEVGSVRLVDFCTLGTKNYVENFPDFLVPPEKRWMGRTPCVMVNEEDWFEVCQGLIHSKVCGVIPVDDVCHIDGRPLVGGLFGVGKNEFVGGVEVQRLIMNFVPLNANCKPLDSDIATLPGISGMSPFLLGDGEIALISSEDIRCFFYLFNLPPNWYPYLAFSKDVPDQLVPSQWRGRRCLLHAMVLPMGFRNSVGIAQHVHRNVIRQALLESSPPVTGEGEMRKDRAFSEPRTSIASTWITLTWFPSVIPTSRTSWRGSRGCWAWLRGKLMLMLVCQGKAS